MNLAKFREQILETCAEAMMDGWELEEIKVSIQIDGPGANSVWSSDLEVKYDNDSMVSGCVILGENSQGSE